MPVARTVLGDIPAEKLGIAFTHEHIAFSWGSARRDLAERYEFEKNVKLVAASVGAAKREYNVNTMVDVSTAEMGRDVDMYAEVSRRSGVNIIASTGSYRQNAGISLYWTMQTGEKFEEYLTREITEGVGKNKIKCGNVKLAWVTYEPTPTEEKVMRATGRVSRRLGVSIVNHCINRGAPPGANAGVRMIDILTSEGCDPAKITIGHAGSFGANLAPLLDVLHRGAYLCFEFLSKPTAGYANVIGTIAGLIAAGYVKQIMLSAEVLTDGTWFTTQPRWNKENWIQDHSYVHRVFIPEMLKAGVREKDIEQMIVTNPKNFLAF